MLRVHFRPLNHYMVLLPFVSQKPEPLYATPTRNEYGCPSSHDEAQQRVMGRGDDSQERAAQRPWRDTVT